MKKIVLNAPISAILEKERKEEGCKEYIKRPRILEGKTVKVKLASDNLYVTVNFDNKGKVIEVFVNLGKSGSEEKAFAEAIGRLISLYLQRGGKVEEVIDTLKDIKGAYVVWQEGKPIYSVPDAVAKILEELTGKIAKKTLHLSKCPQCGEESLYYENGCYTCRSCGYTKCG